MWEQSQELNDALTGGGIVAQELEVFQRASGQSVATFTGLILDGQVTNERAVIRRNLDLTIVDREGVLTPNDAADLFSQWGRYEIIPKRGMVMADGTPQTVPLGRFRIEDVEGAWPKLTVRGYDRMFSIQANGFTVAYTIAAGTLLHEAIARLAEDRWGGELDMDLLTVTDTVPLTVFDETTDPASALHRLATAAGCQIFFDQLGRLVMKREPDLFTERPVWSFVEGERGTALLSGLAKRATAQGAYSGVVAVGESSDLAAPVRGEWWDRRPGSPTEVGAFGRRPRRYFSPLLTSNAQCVDAARKIGLSQLGLSDAIQFPALVIPGLDVSDVIYAYRPRQGVDDRHALDRVVIPLRAAGMMDVQTRAGVVEEFEG